MAKDKEKNKEKTKNSKGRKVKVDMTGVESFSRASEGEHIAKLAKIVQKTSESSGNEMLVATFEITKGDDKGAKVFENYPLIENSRWKLKQLLDAIGMPSEGKLNLDLDAMEGRALIISVFHEDYKGQAKAKIAEVSKLSDKKKPSKPADDEDDDDDDDYDEDDEDDDDDDDDDDEDDDE